jgi:hypothetical protein
MVEKAYGKAVTNVTQVYEWHTRFRDGRVTVNADPCCWHQLRHGVCA